MRVLTILLAIVAFAYAGMAYREQLENVRPVDTAYDEIQPIQKLEREEIEEPKYEGMAYRENQDINREGMAYREIDEPKHEEIAYREKVPLNGFLCSICKPIVQEAEDVGIEYSDEFLKQEVEKNCADAGFFKQLCIDEMNQVVQLLDQYIRQNYSPEVCCKNVGLC